MLKVYGMKICPDTVECIEALTKGACRLQQAERYRFSWRVLAPLYSPAASCRALRHMPVELLDVGRGLLPLRDLALKPLYHLLEPDPRGSA